MVGGQALARVIATARGTNETSLRLLKPWVLRGHGAPIRGFPLSFPELQPFAVVARAALTRWNEVASSLTRRVPTRGRFKFRSVLSGIWLWIFPRAPGTRVFH